MEATMIDVLWSDELVLAKPKLVFGIMPFIQHITSYSKSAKIEDVVILQNSTVTIIYIYIYIYVDVSYVCVV